MGLRLNRTHYQFYAAILWALVFTTGLGLLAYSTQLHPCTAGSHSSGTKYPSTYDSELREASLRFIPQYKWRQLKAQCYQESLLVPTAVSGAGAKGLCQFMPRTWVEVAGRLNLNTSPYNPKANALAAAYYMGQLDAQWTAPRPKNERLKLSRASYNAGLGNILNSQKRCNNALLWQDIKLCLGFRETDQYVTKIEYWYNDMITTTGGRIYDYD